MLGADIMATKQTKTAERFSEAESVRYSEIQNLACKYLNEKPGAEWIFCVTKATKEVDSKNN